MTSTSSSIRPLDPADRTALHEQAAAQIRRAIAEGQVAPGERLPPAGDLAAVLGVNRNTMLRALRLLREEGVVEFRRGRGITITAAPQHTDLLSGARDLLARPAATATTATTSSASSRPSLAPDPGGRDSQRHPVLARASGRRRMSSGWDW